MPDSDLILLYCSLGATALLVALFFVAWRRNKMSLLPGLLFIMAAGGFTLCYYLAVMLLWTDNIFAMLGLVASAVLLILITIYGLYALALFFLINASVVYRRESRSLANSLTLIAAAGIILFLAVSFVFANFNPPTWLQVLWTGLLLPLGFYLVHALCYLASLILCNLARPRPNQDYIIILGCGLIDGNVSPMLKRRIDRALGFARRQIKKTGKRPVLVVSGGKGSDESRSEAAAMADYLGSCEWPATHLILEDRSRNTLENMRFSKALIDARHAAASSQQDAGRARGGLPYSCIFSTNTFHLLRAGMYARQAGMRIDGIGARSTMYFAPNATLREYIAYLVLHKVRVAVSFALLFLTGVLLHLAYLALYQYFS